MKLELYEQISGLIKSLNTKMNQYRLTKDNENLKFINELRNELLEVITGITETYIALTTNNASEEKFRLVAEQVLFEDAGYTVFVLVDLETGEISVLDYEGDNQAMSKINGKEVKSTYQIKTLMETTEVSRRVGCLTPSEENIDLRLLDYVRKSPEIFNGDYRTR